MKIKIIFSIIILCAQYCEAQTATEKITREVIFEKVGTTNTVLIANLNGNIKVIGYDGDKVLVEVEKIITAKTSARLERGKQEIKLGTINNVDTLIFYVEGSCNAFVKRQRRGDSEQKGWGYSGNNCEGRNCHEEYDYKMNFIVRVPAYVHVNVSTINDGDIIVENTKGKVNAVNVNGAIKLTNLTQAAVASTINGDVDVEYAHNPDKDCRFYTLNGDINANFQKGLAASMSFESFNGSFYTNISTLEPMPVHMEKINEGAGIKYKIKGDHYQIGKGGALLDFETFNGNVYLKEKTN